MTRDRFLHILHFPDNSQRHDEGEEHDWLWKLRTVFDKLNGAYAKFYNPPEHLAVDEVTVKFKGRVVFRQYIPKRRKLFGIRIYKLCAELGYTYDMRVYLDRDSHSASDDMTATHATVRHLTCRVEGLLTYLLTPWSRVLLEKLTGFPANQEIPCILWNLKVYYHTHKRLPPVPILSQLHPVPTTPSHFRRSILILSSHLCLGLPNSLFPSGFPTKTLYVTLLSPIRATCVAHLILLYLITRMIFGEGYRLLSSSLCSLLHSPVIPTFLGPNILLNTLFSHTLKVSNQFSHPYETRLNYGSVYLTLYSFG